jgi:hypothetical protein
MGAPIELTDESFTARVRSTHDFVGSSASESVREDAVTQVVGVAVGP